LFGSGDLPSPSPHKEETKVPQPSDEEGEPFSNYGSLSAFQDEENSAAGVSQATRSTAATAASINSKSLMPHRPRENPCLWLFHFLQGVAVLVSLCLLATQLIPLFLMSAADYSERIGILSVALKVYIALFCLMFVVVETGLPVPFVRSSQLLQNYLSRGFIYSFLGLICVEEAYSERVKDLITHGKDEFHVGWVAIFMQLSSWLMLGVGVLYMLLGMCCLNLLRVKLQKKEKEDWKRYREQMKLWKEMNT
jgi:hypothetical protein